MNRFSEFSLTGNCLDIIKIKILFIEVNAALINKPIIKKNYIMVLALH